MVNMPSLVGTIWTLLAGSYGGAFTTGTFYGALLLVPDDLARPSM